MFLSKIKIFLKIAFFSVYTFSYLFDFLGSQAAETEGWKNWKIICLKSYVSKYLKLLLFVSPSLH